MSAESARRGANNSSDPVEHDLVSFNLGGDTVSVRVVVRRADQDGWRGKIVFRRTEAESGVATAEILYADSEADFWQCVKDLNPNHIKDLYRSVAG